MKQYNFLNEFNSIGEKESFLGKLVFIRANGEKKNHMASQGVLLHCSVDWRVVTGH